MAHLDLTRGVVGLVGSGNNGGDTLIALTRLAERGIQDFCIFRASSGRRSPGGGLPNERVERVIDLVEKGTLSHLNAAPDPWRAVLLDGMLGTGFRFAPERLVEGAYGTNSNP